jgi:hypothetical protein
MDNHTKVKVQSLPNCDLAQSPYSDHDGDRPAKYDAKTTLGPWANLCETCFQRYGVGLGLGKGQELIVEGGE